uniref:Uncharacterized protein n=1 Tax=Bubo bubo TaxID=30461 RepID=A0A8C0IHD0_BUBBB
MDLFSYLDPKSTPELLRCLVSHDISLQALVHFLAIHQKPIVKLPEAEGSDKSFWHLMTAGKKYAANSGSTTGFWRDMNEGPQGR